MLPLLVPSVVGILSFCPGPVPTFVAPSSGRCSLAAIVADEDMYYMDFGLVSREQQGRSYASVSGFLRIASGGKALPSDLKSPSLVKGSQSWLSNEKRLQDFALGVVSYPLLLSVLAPLVAANGGVNELSAAFLPAISIIFATLLSLTLCAPVRAASACSSARSDRSPPRVCVSLSSQFDRVQSPDEDPRRGDQRKRKPRPAHAATP